MNKKGFTLIEVLLVVLVVGVLASLAMPQYTKVVEKAKMSEAKTVLSAIRTAEGVYFMEFDEYTSDMDNLDLDDAISDSDLFAYEITLSGTNADSTFGIKATRSGGAFDGGEILMAANGVITGGAIYADENMIRDSSTE